MHLCVDLLKYRMWENFGGGNFWRINGYKVFGEEKFGESVGSILKILAFINNLLLVGKILANCQLFAKFAKIFPLQNFPTYGIYFELKFNLLKF